MRAPSLDRDRKIGAQLIGDAAAGREAWADQCRPALEPAAQLARSGKRDSDRPERRFECDRGIGDVEREIGQSERLVAWRWEQFVDLAPVNLAADQRAAQAHPARDDAIDLEASGPGQPGLDFGMAGRQIGVLGVADDEVADLL